ncbi:MAG: hypothetical protein D6705_00875 [Deltaproteobacteria bacterium]|nr:MAG: hypothetical protein D6705_00875 [Deltaproteobacteria bacterium]
MECMVPLARHLAICLFMAATTTATGCGDDHHGSTEADEKGVGAACTNDADCNPEDADTDGMQDQSCLTQFAGGYCGLEGCMDHDDCPEGSACVIHDDGKNYCFRICVDKSECNENRPADVESNCSANIDFTSPLSVKACVPPSSGV